MGYWRAISLPAAMISFAVAPCQATDYLSIEEAQKLTFPHASSFVASHIIFTPEQKLEIENKSGVTVSNRAQKVWRVLDQQQTPIGWFVVDYVIGKHLLIDYAVAINSHRQVLDVEVLSYRESYGGEIRSRNWLDQFKGKSTAEPLRLNQDITNIGGATLSSRHVTEGIKRILATIDVTQNN